MALVILLVLLASLLVVRLWYLQIYDYDRFEVLSKDNRVRLMPVPPVRGQIYDRNGKVLAENVPVFTLEISPNKVDDMDALLNDLSKIVEVSPSEIEKFRSQVRARPGFEAQVLKLHLSDEEMARFVVNQHRLLGAQVEARLQRNYPYGPELVHVIGYVGRINQRDAERIDERAYKGTDYIGKLGIEAQYEAQLLGEVGVEQVETNAHGQRIRTLDRTAPISGDNLYLNIDADLQIKAREYLDGRRGAIVAIEPESGDVLAFVSNPVYDPNKFVNGIDHLSYNALRDDINRPLLNRGLSGRYAPGSTIKGLISMVGLENGWDPNKKVVCNGYFTLKGSSHRYRCWKRVGHGPMSLADSIVHSCDVFYYQLSSTLGIDKISSFLSQFGLGQKTGIDLPSEPTGLIPSREWKRERYGVSWYPGDTLNSGIGQGFTLVTPLQLGVMTATLANRGERVEPRIVDRLEHAIDGHSMREVIPQQGASLGRVEAQDTSYAQIIDAMHDVVQGPAGTARRSGLDALYTIAGKTGTAQVVGIPQGAKYDASILSDFEKDHALFVAFAPVDKPKIAVAVIVENGGSGSGVAAPVARKVMDYYLLGVDANAPPVEVINSASQVTEGL
ncbi:penicillin-binding protein 2 [Arenicella xantha]|uniref:Peptidoglycan D,D-transpeptidase MrdA n=2 Tax=Arenicella xantha TaxID=644221 RepID=A0A395JJQ9_9GAMM|nr:penicillin-binding protein 2 [Arenicella xantha]